MNVLELIKNDTCVKLDYNNIKDATSKLVNDSIDDEAPAKYGFKKPFYISLVSVLLIVLIASVVLISYKEKQVGNINTKDDYSSEVAQINYSIDNLKKLGTLEEKMIEICEIEKQIQNLPEDVRKSIDNDALQFYKATNSNALKNNVTWGSYLNSSISCYLLGSIIDTSSIDNFEIKSSDEDLNILILESPESIRDIIKLVDVPYSDVVPTLGDEGIIANTGNVQKAMSNDSYAIYILSSTIEDNKCIDFSIYANGYILMTISNIEARGKIVTNSYTSLVKIDYNVIDTMINSDGE